MLRNMTKRQAIAAYLVLTLALVGGIALGTKANATDTPETTGGECVRAGTETVEHDAVTKEEGEYKKWIVTQEAVPGVPAEYEVEHQYKKQTQTTKIGRLSGDVKSISDWSWWSPASYQWSTTETDVLESGHHGSWIEGFYRYEREYRYAPTGETRQGELITPEVPAIEEQGEWQYAWGEVGTFSREWIDTGDRRDVLVKEAWTETIDHPETGNCAPDPEPSPDVTPTETAPPAEPETPKSQRSSSTFTEAPEPECAPDEGLNTRGQCVKPTFTG